MQLWRPNPASAITADVETNFGKCNYIIRQHSEPAGYLPTRAIKQDP